MTDRDRPNDRPTVSPMNKELPSARKKRVWAGAALCLLALGGGLFLFRERLGLRGEEKTKPVAQRPAAAMSQSMAQATSPLANQNANPSVRLSREDQQMIGVEITPVTYQTLIKEIDAVGKIDYDERKIAQVPSRIAGRLDKLYVNFTGTRVEKGEPLALIYSPDLVATQREYLLAVETLERVKGSGIKEVVESAGSLVEAARNRLLLWGVTEGQIAKTQADRRDHFQMTTHSPISGTVIEKMAFEGKYVMEGEALYKVADLSTV